MSSPGLADNTGISLLPGVKRRTNSPPLPLVLAALAICLAMMVPIVYLTLRTVDAWDRVWPLIFRARTAEILWNTVSLALAVSVSTLVLAVPLAWLTTRTDLPLANLWSTLLPLPLVIPSYAGAVAIIGMLGPRGILQKQLSAAGFDWFPNIYGFGGSWFVLTLFTYPYVYLSVRGALQNLDPASEEASRTLGHGPYRTFLHCVLPQLGPSIGAGLLLVSLYTISDFGVVTMLRFETFTRSIYTQYRAAFDRSLAAALGLILVMMAIGILVTEARFQRRASFYRVESGAARRPRIQSLGRWRWPAFIWCSLVSLMALGLPIGMFLYWIATGTSAGQQLDRLPAAIWGSLSVGGAAAAGAVVTAFPIAILAARYRHSWAAIFERWAYLGFALPGIVIALSFVFVGARFLPSLYQTFLFLVIAMIIRFLSHAVGAVKSSLLQVNPNLLHASRSLGRSSPETAVRITVPLTWSGITTGAILVFLGAMKELPIVILLAPTGFRTLATEIWSATDGGALGRAAAPALILIGLSMIPTLAFDRRFAESGRQAE